MVKCKMGNNDFINCAFPLVIVNKFFMIENMGGQHIFSVFNLIDGKIVFEIIKNEPVENPYITGEKNPTGVITISNKETESYLYKIRPDNKSSLVFGIIAGEEKEIKIKDRFIEYNTNTIAMNTF